MKLNEKLTRLRKEKELSQNNLAELLGVSRQAVSRWEVGLSVPSTENLKCLSDLYGVSLDTLLADTAGMQDDTRKQTVRVETPDTAKDEESSSESKTKSNGILKYVAVFSCVAVLILAIVVIFLVSRDGKKTVKMETIEPVESFSVSTEKFSINW